MKIENRLVYIAEDGQEFDSEDACKDREMIIDLNNFLDSRYFDGTWDIAEFIVGNFAKIKEIVEACD